MPRKPTQSSSSDPSPSSSTPSSSSKPTIQSLPTPDPTAYKTYTYTPTEKSIFTPSPYKDLLLPHWRFATPDLARTSSTTIFDLFTRFLEADDFVGADNARKFLQMGMTRAGRYGNWKGGRKYDVVGGKKVLRSRKKGRDGGRGLVKKDDDGEEKDEEEEEEDWEGRKEKKEASAIFRAKWERAKGDGRYLRLKGEFLERQREWKEEGKAS